MNLISQVAKVFLPNDESWLRHANPWSVWTRFATLPFLVLATWSRVWIDWYCLIPVLILLGWIYINPRVFSKPASYDSWGSKAVLGEKIFVQQGLLLNKKHKLPILILNILQTLSGLILLYGLWQLNLYHVVYGMICVYLSKMWFLDRMVWLYEEAN